MTEAAQSSKSSETSAHEAELWARWYGLRDEVAREQLIAFHMPLARTLAAVSFKGRFNDEVEFADYLQLACVGLMESVDRYEPGQGVPFKSYAGHRIRGAILNGLDKETEKNQQIAAQRRIRKDRLESLKEGAKATLGQEGSVPKPGSHKAQQDLLNYLAEVGIGLAIGVLLEDSAMIVGEDMPDTSELASPEVSYFRKSETRRLRDALQTAMVRLADKERSVIQYHYQQDIAFEEVGRLLGLSRGRVSQLHRQALSKLRIALGQGPPLDVAW
ncbi:MAG TPA: sigma-70 family RNA polymerase sigma factor [Ensifer sp.]|jgi:RNA polymerase sigma factor for flagellar operon FliA|uniref:sigma-70 family RNA polymerase sigma factor n=1 Tax=Ensifer sp. TaxID=1872086 RepID=UPI002E159CE9|nr:sigma-70 family RNA polymerase sigma factor [Ensifer sp.]